MTAVLLLLARIFKLGFLADFLSRTVLTGFLAGVGLQVGIAMLGDMSGIQTASHRTLFQIQDLWQNYQQLNVDTAGLSVLVVMSIFLGRHFARKFPVPLVVIIAAITASAVFGFEANGIAVIGPVPGGLPSIKWPNVSLSDARALLPIAVSCFVMIIAQSAATSRVYAARHQERVDENADILGLAAANAAAGMSGAFVVNGSPTQTAMADNTGARSQVAQVVFAAVVLLVLLFLTRPLQFLPRCVLASIVFTIAIGMIDLRSLRAIRCESPGEFLLAVFTAAAVVLVGVEQGILMAIALSLLRHVRHSYHPHTMVLTPDATGEWIPAPAIPGLETEPGLIVYRFGSDLFYANDTRFVDEVRALVLKAPAPVHWFIVDAGPITDIDYSAARSIRNLVSDLGQHGVEVIFARVSPYLRSDMDRHGVTAAIGAAHFFSTLHEAIAAARGATWQAGETYADVVDPVLTDRKPI